MKRDTIVGLLGILVLLTGVVAVLTLQEESAEAPAAEAEGPDAVPVPQLPAPESFQLADCAVVEAAVVVPADRARALVPPDFDLVTTAQGVQAILGGSACATGPSGAPVSFGLLAIEVTPGNEVLRAEGVGRYFYKPEVDLPPAELAYLYTKFSGSFTPVAAVTATASGTGAGLEIVGDGWRHHITALLAPPTPASGALDFRFREYSPAEGGYAYLDATWERAPQSVQSVSAGTIGTGDGTVARDLIGASAQGAIVYWTHMTYADATIGHVAVGEDASA